MQHLRRSQAPINQFGSAWQQCGRKKAYSRKEARRLCKRSIKPLRAYLCPVCNEWHLTHRGVEQ